MQLGNLEAQIVACMSTKDAALLLYSSPTGKAEEE